MKISLKDISDYGLNFEKVVIPQEIGLKDDIFKCLIPLAIKARIEKAKDAVLAKVEVKGKYEFSCARCLEPIVEERADQFDLYFELEPQTEQIDLGEDIRQELIVTLSVVMLCRNDCRGMCSECGANLNKEECRCVKKNKQETGIFKPGQI